MSLPLLLIRPMLAGERMLILSNWKVTLWAERKATEWGKAMRARDFWSLTNFVIDRITLPSCETFMACSSLEFEVPMAWAVVRDGKALHMHARAALDDDAELRAELHRALLTAAHATVAEEFNPFMELRR